MGFGVSPTLLCLSLGREVAPHMLSPLISISGGNQIIQPLS